MEQKIEVTKRIESEEGRIKQPSKVIELRKLRDSVFRSRKELFHWNLNNSVEHRFREKVSGDHRVTDLESEATTDIQENIPSMGIQPQDGRVHETDKTGMDAIRIASDSQSVQKEATAARKQWTSCNENSDALTTVGFNYDINSFVAVLASGADSGQHSFWIGKVIEANANRHGVVELINVHWYQPYSRNGNNINCFLDMYAPSYINQKTQNERPWRGEVDTSAVLINFSSLLKNRRLPAAVQKHLRATIPSPTNCGTPN